MRLFRRKPTPTEVESRRADLTRQRAEAAEQLAALRAEHAAALVAGDDTTEIEARLAALSTRESGLTEALRLLGDEATAAASRERAARREQHRERARVAAEARQEAAQRFDAAAASLSRAWDDYHAATVELDQALRAAGEQTSGVSRALHRQALAALWAGARPLCRRLRIPRAHRLQPLAEASSPGASPLGALLAETPATPAA
jgi:chromosome segregation ATPase